MILNIAILVAGFAWLVLLTWVVYLAIMMLKQALKTGALNDRPYAKAFGYGALWLIGLPLDFCLNVACSIPFAQPPLELTLTARLKKNVEKYPRWRGKLARWICYEFLEFADPGHC